MQSVLLTVHLLACIALVISVMLQRSEGGALGMGGGGTGGLISGRGAAGVLVRTTMVLAAIFFATSITMTYLNNQAAHAPTVLDRPADQPATPPTTPSTAPVTPAPVDPLGGATTTTPPAATTAPAAAPTTAPATTPPAASTPDPLAPATQPAPATTAPTSPAPTPENGGTPN